MHQYQLNIKITKDTYICAKVRMYTKITDVIPMDRKTWERKCFVYYILQSFRLFHDEFVTTEQVIDDIIREKCQHQ